MSDEPPRSTDARGAGRPSPAPAAGRRAVGATSRGHPPNGIIYSKTHVRHGYRGHWVELNARQLAVLGAPQGPTLHVFDTSTPEKLDEALKAVRKLSLAGPR